MDFYTYIINDGFAGLLESDPTIKAYTSYIQDSVMDLIESFKFQPSSITRSITHNFVMRINVDNPVRDELSYKIDPCASLTPFIFSASSLREKLSEDGKPVIDSAKYVPP